MDDTTPSAAGTPLPDQPPAPGDEVRPYPVVLHLAGASCLVVGAGAVGARKAAGLLAAGAQVTVVAPELGPDLVALVDGAGERMTVRERPYETGDVPGHLLVVSATGDPGVDARVASDAAAAGVLVNRAGSRSADPGHTPPPAGSVDLPAVHRVGPVIVAVSTGGSSPVLARWLRDRVAGALPTDVDALARLVDQARAAALAAGDGDLLPPDDDAVSRAVALLADGRTDEARAALERRSGVTPSKTPADERSGR